MLGASRCLGIVAAGVAIVAAAAYSPPAGARAGEKAIVDLSSDNFSAVINASGARMLVSFYAPWCAHSQRLGVGIPSSLH